MSQEAKIRQSRDFRTVYSNGLGVQFMGIDAILRFSILDNPADPHTGSEEQVAIAMNVQNFKALGQMIMAIVARHEELTNAQIEVNPRAMETVMAAIAAAKKPPGK